MQILPLPLCIFIANGIDMVQIIYSNIFNAFGLAIQYVYLYF